MKHFPPPLRYTIPATLLALSALVSAYSLQKELSLGHRRNVEKVTDAVRFVGDRTAGILTYLYRRNGGNGSELIMSQLQDEANLRIGVLFSEHNQVMLSTMRWNQTPTLDKLLPHEEQQRLERVRRDRTGQVYVSDERVVALYPVPLSAQAGEVIPSRVGVLVLQYDSLRGLRQQALMDALRRSLESSVVLAVLCIGVWYVFDKSVTLRAKRLVAATNRLSAGDLAVRVGLRGSDELAQIAEAFDQMASMIQSKTEALQQSQENLATAHAEVSSQAAQLSRALQELRTTQTQLIQTEKMSSLGQLVAGIAHEINNPVNFIHGNLQHLREYSQDLLGLVYRYQQECLHTSADLQAYLKQIDLEFIESDLPQILNSIETGTERIRQIVLTLRNFSRLDEAEMKPVDIHEGIDSTLMILQHRLNAQSDRPAIQIIKQYDNLPPVECYASQLNQVFMNILSNAIDALETKCMDAQGTAVSLQPLIITIRTHQLTPERIAIQIHDNGPGIPENIQARLFDPFFTTKPVGKGTGLGLSISYQIVVEKHKGLLKCSSCPGEGTCFWIEIPIAQHSLGAMD